MAKANAGNPDKIICPCKRCANGCHQYCDIVYEHLVINGMDPSYTVWVLHGEDPMSYVQQEGDTDDDAYDDVEMSDMYRMYRDVYFEGENDDVMEPTYEARETEFTKSLELAKTPLYPECTSYTVMSAIVSLYKHKAAHNLSDSGFNELLGILHGMLPKDNKLPEDIYKVKKLFKVFDLGYEKIHACINDCCLFRNEKENMDTCPKCGKSRWKVNERTKKIQKNVPVKVLRYFPIIPRFRRMFRSIEMAEQLRWHSHNKSQDRKMRHPVDSLAWDTIDRKWPDFASDPRNLRLGLSTDGFNPFGDLSSRYSCWPVILVIYNLPPLLCMSKEGMMLTLLIPGPKQPGNDIDVYLEPLIDDLKKLWFDGADMYDAFSKSLFNLRALMMWTINDYPALGNLSGQATKGDLACTVCCRDTYSWWLTSSQKSCFTGHRRFLPHNHPFRKKKAWFDGNEEHRGRPKLLSGSEVFQIIKDFKNDWGKSKGTTNLSKRKRKNKDKRDKPLTWPWKKKSIFFELPYWEVSDFL